jgi:HAD superfamily hydrolase (TIGR01490 family)
MTLAIFDIDGTLVECSTERRFWRYLALRGYFGPRQLLSYCWFWLRFLPVYGLETAKKNKAYLWGLSKARVESLAKDFVAAEIVPRLYAPAVDRLQHHARRGDAVILMSGTLEPIANALAVLLGVQHVRATVCGVAEDGTYLASPPPVHPFGPAKLALAIEVAAELQVDLHSASAYGDSEHDLKLLEAVGHPVAVRPDARLLATARGNRWDIIAGRNVPSALPQERGQPLRHM